MPRRDSSHSRRHKKAADDDDATAVPTATEGYAQTAEGPPSYNGYAQTTLPVHFKAADANMVSILRAACDEDDEKAARHAAEEAAEKEFDFDGVVYEKAW